MTPKEIAAEAFPPDIHHCGRGICGGCGQEVVDEGSLTHTRAEHHPVCDGDCWNCPAPVVCGPIDDVVDYNEEPRIKCEAAVIKGQREVLEQVLTDDASGRPIEALLEAAADVLLQHGGGPLETCLRLKAGQLRELRAMLAKLEGEKP